VIISHRFRYVFIELPRTGSSAISEELRHSYDGKPILGKHSTYQDFLKVATPEEAGYFAFAGIRNPLDVTVSRYVQVLTDARERFTDARKRARRDTVPEQIENRVYAWVHRTNADFESFLRHWYWLPYDTWSSLDHHRLDHVIRFEALVDDFDAALRRMGIEPVRPLPVRNATPGREREFEDYFTPGTIGRASWVFGPYMREWGYEFPESFGDAQVPAWSVAALKVLRLYRGLYWRHLRRARGACKRG
jgi:hypothetical protein